MEAHLDSHINLLMGKLENMASFDSQRNAWDGR